MPTNTQNRNSTYRKSRSLATKRTSKKYNASKSRNLATNSKPVGNHQGKKSNNYKRAVAVRQQLLNALQYQQLTHEEKMLYHVRNRTGYQMSLEPDREVWLQLQAEYDASLLLQQN